VYFVTHGPAGHAFLYYRAGSAAAAYAPADVPEAVAILAPVDGIVMRVLIADRGISYPATVRISRIDAVADEVTWYPYGAGAFGARMML